MKALVLLGLASGCVWGIFGYWFASDTGLAPVAWVGLLASPLIGVAISLIAGTLNPRTLGETVVIASLNLFLAVFLFCAVLVVAPLPERRTPPRLSTATIEVIAPDPCKDVQTTKAALCGGYRGPALVDAIEAAAIFMFSGYGLIFLPLSVLNHLLIWSRPT